MHSGMSQLYKIEKKSLPPSIKFPFVFSVFPLEKKAHKDNSTKRVSEASMFVVVASVLFFPSDLHRIEWIIITASIEAL